MKKLLTMLLAIILCLLFFVACDMKSYFEVQSSQNDVENKNEKENKNDETSANVVSETEECDHPFDNVVIHEAKVPTCTENGWDAYIICSKCGLSTYVEKEALGHTPSAGATCIEPQKCIRCSVEIELALGHTYVNVGDVCTNCGAVKYSEGLKLIMSGNGTCYVSGMGNCTDKNIFIPPVSPNGYKVTTIDDFAFSECISLESIIIPDSITSIGVAAFNGCSSLENITIPDSVTSIGNEAFSACSNLTTVNIPDTVTSIGSYAFNYCTSLKSISIHNGVTRIGEGAFYRCTSLDNITISDSVTNIDNYAFHQCIGLVSISIGEGVTSIGNHTFSDCDNLENIEVAEGNSVYYSDGNCLIETQSKILIYGCKNSIIPKDGSVISIGSSAFYGCSSLKSIMIPEGVVSIGDWAFSDSNLRSITISNSVTSIGEYAFSSCRSLKTVYYTGSEEEWAAIAIDRNGNECLTSANIIYNYVPEE